MKDIYLEIIFSHASYISQLQVDMSGTYTPRPNRYYYKKCIESMVYTPQTVELYVPHKYFLKQDTSYIRDNGASGSTENQSAPTNPYGQYYYIDETNVNANPENLDNENQEGNNSNYNNNNNANQSYPVPENQILIIE